MKVYKTVKDDKSILAQYLLEYVRIEQEMKLRRATKDGWVKTSILMQYFADAELRKRYPKERVEKVLSALVQAGLLQEREVE